MKAAAAGMSRSCVSMQLHEDFPMNKQQQQQQQRALPGYETLSGRVSLSTAQAPRARTVNMTVYHNHVDLFAVVKPDSVFAAKGLYLNLKNCSVEVLPPHQQQQQQQQQQKQQQQQRGVDCSLLIRSRDGEGDWLMVKTQSPEDVVSWLAILRGPAVTKRASLSPLPVLPECAEECE